MNVVLTIPDEPPAACLSWRLHVHTELTRDRASGEPRVPGRSRHEPVRLTRRPDRLSPMLLHACAAGARLPGATVRVLVDDVAQLEVLLRDVIVVSVLSSLEPDGPLETVDLSYGVVTWRWCGDDRPERTWNVFEGAR